MDRPTMRISASVLGTPDPPRLARFYAELLGWDVGYEEPTWVMLRNRDGGIGLSFQLEPVYDRPVWPSRPGTQQMMVHLDIGVDDLDAAVAWAVENGAREAEWQPQDAVRVMVDPDGHPFCLFVRDA